MSNIEIKSSSYTNLTENLSEKNIIDDIYGKEYIIITNNKNQLGSKIINPNTLERVFKSKPYNKENKKYCPIINANYGHAGGNWFIDIPFYGRTESGHIIVYYEIETNEIISDYNDIINNFEITYLETDSNWNFSKNNYSALCTTSFFDNGYEFNVPEDENELLSLEKKVQNTFINTGNSKLIVKNSLNYTVREEIIELPKVNESIYVSQIKKDNDKFIIGIVVCARIWSASHNTVYHTFPFDLDGEGKTIAVTSIKIDTYANTIDTKEVPFSYSTKKQHKQYELETNELFQTIYSDGSEIMETDKLSYKSSKEILDKFSYDRRIITFDLLNPVKILVDDSEKFITNKDKIYRYLEIDDEFNIQDEKGNWILNDETGEKASFKVIQSNPIWDGSYHKIITARLLK